MKSKKHIVQLSFIVMITSLIVFTVLEFRLYPYNVQIWISNLLGNNAKKMEDYLIVIFSGIFTGAILSVFVTLREYMDAKEYDLVEYYKASSEINRQIRKIPYLDIRQPYDLVEACIAEEDGNRSRVRYNEQLKRAIEESECTEENKHIAYENNYEEMIFATKEKMQEYIWDMLDEKTKERLEEIGQRIHFLEQEYSNIMQGYYAKIDEIMRYYIELSETDYWNVEVGYGKIDFLLGNKKKRNAFIYERLHDKERNILRKIKWKVRHFHQYYQADIGSLRVPLREIVDLQNDIFEMVDEEWGYKVYNSLSFELDTDLTKLLKSVYGKKYEDKIEKNDYIAISVITNPEKLYGREQGMNITEESEKKGRCRVKYRQDKYVVNLIDKIQIEWIKLILRIKRVKRRIFSFVPQNITLYIILTIFWGIFAVFTYYWGKRYYFPEAYGIKNMLWELKNSFFTSVILAMLIAIYSQNTGYKKSLQIQHNLYVDTMRTFEQVYKQFIGAELYNYMPFYNQECLELHNNI